jgi:RNA polymerase sigma factor (sigma-70 family)
LATLAAPGVSATARSRVDVTDHDLVQAVRAGDDLAFERLYDRYHRRIAAYIVGMVRDHGRAEDLTQEVFVSALRRMRQTGRPIAFKPWIYEIAKNACIDAFRRSRRAEEVSYDAEEGLGAGDYGKLVATTASPDAAVDAKQRLDHLCGAFGGLSDAHHQILVMRELEGLSYREIGERLGMSRPSVESTLFRARRRLTEEYGELVSGERCQRIQGIIDGAGQRPLGARDQRRVGSHIAHCRPCRRQACLAGLDAAALVRRPARARIAALLPLPAFLRRRWLPSGDDGGAASAATSHAHALSMAAAQYGESSMGAWMKAAALAGAVAVTGLGAGTAVHRATTTHHGAPAAHHAPSAPAAGRASAGATHDTSSAAAPTGAARHAGGSTGAAKGGSGAPGAHGGRSHGEGAAGRPSDPSSGSGPGSGGSGSGSGSRTAGGGAGADTPAVQEVTKPLTSVTDTVTDAGTGATGAAGSEPLVDPDPSQVLNPPSVPASEPPSVGGVVTQTTDTVGGTVGGTAGQAVKDAGSAVGDTVDGATGAVGGALGGIVGGP